MKRERFYRFLTGSLIVQADGAFTERLVNIFMHRGFPIWDVRRLGSSRITFKTDIASYLKIRTPARRTKSHVRILKRCGLPFIIKKYQHRYLLLPGIVIFSAIIFYASTHIMGITVYGNNRIDTQVVLSALSESGLNLGGKTSEINPASIRNQMMTKLDELAWIGINANGSRVYIEIVERVEKEQGLDKTALPCHLVAKKDGEIDTLEIREGQTIVKAGSGVRKGDVLVSGIVDNSVNGFRYVHSRGEVFAKTIYTKTGSFPLSFVETTTTENQKCKYTVSFLNKDIPLFFSKNPPYEEYNYEENTNEYRLPIDILPSVFITKQVYTQELKSSKTRTPKEAIAYGEKELSESLKNELSDDIEILEQKTSHTLNERGEVEVTVTLFCRENIAQESVIEIPLPPDAIEE